MVLRTALLLVLITVAACTPALVPITGTQGYFRVASQ